MNGNGIWKGRAYMSNADGRPKSRDVYDNYLDSGQVFVFLLQSRLSGTCLDPCPIKQILAAYPRLLLASTSYFDKDVGVDEDWSYAQWICSCPGCRVNLFNDSKETHNNQATTTVFHA